MRDALAAQAASRAQRAEDTMVAMVDAYLDRVLAVVRARLRGPKARRGTRHWTPDRAKSASGAGETVRSGTNTHLQHLRPDVETKTIDTDHVVPDSLIGEIVETARPVALRVARDAAADAAARLGVDVPDTSATADGMFAIDEELLADLIDEALEDMLAAAGRHAQGLRQAILTGEDEGIGLDELLDRVEEAATRGGNWLRLHSRTIATALAGKATIEQARALGVGYVQWLSRRDGKVRLSHVIADGSVRLAGEPFTVGRHELEYPGDPSGLPGTAEEVHNCFVAGTRISASGVEASFRAPYIGKLVTVHTATGRTLTGTPNHPVLAERGWVGLGELEQGDHLFGTHRGEQVEPWVNPHIKNSPATIEQVHDALAITEVVRRVPAGTVNFHGDRPDGEVDIVTTDRPLSVGCDTSILEQDCQSCFPRRDEALAGGICLGSPGPASFSVRAPLIGESNGASLQASLLSPHRVNPGSQLDTSGAQASGGSARIEVVVASEGVDRVTGDVSLDQHVSSNGQCDPRSASGFRTASKLLARIDETSSDGSLRRSESTGDVHGGVAVSVELDRVVNIDMHSFAGHVYTLQTASGVFLAEGILTKNCRCALLLADPDDDFWSALDAIHAAAVDGPDAAGVVDVLAAAVVADQFVPGPDLPGLPGIAAAVTVPGDVVGWRVMATVLDVAPGQQIQLPAGTTLGLLAPPELTSAVLAVLVPAGTTVGVTGGALVLTEAAAVSVLAAGAAGVQGRLVTV